MPKEAPNGVRSSWSSPLIPLDRSTARLLPSSVRAPCIRFLALLLSATRGEAQRHADGGGDAIVKSFASTFAGRGTRHLDWADARVGFDPVGYLESKTCGIAACRHTLRPLDVAAIVPRVGRLLHGRRSPDVRRRRSLAPRPCGSRAACRAPRRPHGLPRRSGPRAPSSPADSESGAEWPA
jgi:hypothetical protein